MILTGENRRTLRITSPSAIFSTTNHTWTDPCANPGLCCKKPATNRLSYGTAYKWGLVEEEEILPKIKGRNGIFTRGSHLFPGLLPLATLKIYDFSAQTNEFSAELYTLLL
jgi:hypothetical protein